MLQVVKLKATQTPFSATEEEIACACLRGPEVKEHVLLLAPPFNTTLHRKPQDP